MNYSGKYPKRIADLEEQWTDMSHKVYDYARALDEILIIADFLLKKLALHDNHFFVLQTKKIFQLAKQAREK